MKKIAKKLFQRLGYDIVAKNGATASDGFPPDLTPEEKEIVRLVTPFTMTSVERVVSLVHAARYVVENSIAGDIVECGVWRGGSAMAVAEVMSRLGDTSRKLYLYDTFEGMSEPTDKDKQFDGAAAAQLLSGEEKNTGIWCYAGRDEVAANLGKTGYPPENIVYVEGKIEDTVPGTMPAEIALLRLDTDWYESTHHELTHLYPRLVRGGVLIIDDYGHWQGAKEATDEYFANLGGPRPFLHRIDYTGRLLIKA